MFQYTCSYQFSFFSFFGLMGKQFRISSFFNDWPLFMQWLTANSIAAANWPGVIWNGVVKWRNTWVRILLVPLPFSKHQLWPHHMHRCQSVFASELGKHTRRSPASQTSDLWVSFGGFTITKSFFAIIWSMSTSVNPNGFIAPVFEWADTLVSNVMLSSSSVGSAFGFCGGKYT